MYTWYIDHSLETKTCDPKLATLGGYPPDWESDLKFPWHHRIIPGEKVHIDLVRPTMARLSFHEHIAHVILTQHRASLYSILLVVELLYARPMVFRCVLAVPTPCTRQDILSQSPIAMEYADLLRWQYPKLPPGVDSFPVIDGQAVHITVDPEETVLSDHLSPDTNALLQTHTSVAPSCAFHSAMRQETSWCNRYKSFRPVYPHGSSQPTSYGLNLPGDEPERRHYAFNPFAPEFAPGLVPIAEQSSFVQNLYETWNQVAFSWQDAVSFPSQIATWMVDHRNMYPSCLFDRLVNLDHRFDEWETRIKEAWRDQLDPLQVLTMHIVAPSPIQLEQGVVAHIILVQAPREGWISVLITVDDRVFTRINAGIPMKLVATLDAQFTVDQVSQACGYPANCVWNIHALRCEVSVGQQRLTPGPVWQGSTGVGFLLRITRPPPVVAPSEQIQAHLGLYQREIQLRKLGTKCHMLGLKIQSIQCRPLPPRHNFNKINLVQPPKTGDNLNGHDQSDAQLGFDELSLMAKGRANRIVISPQSAIAMMPEAVQQEDAAEEEPPTSDGDSSSTDLNWQETVLYSPVCEPVIRQINIPSVPLRLHQITRAFGWAPGMILMELPLTIRPDDLVENRLHGRLVRRIDDLPQQSDLVLVLIDTVFHAKAPSRNPSTVRKAMYIFPQLTARQLIRSMYLQRYCDYNLLPCIVRHNRVIWRQDFRVAHQVGNGDYLSIEVPPPNPPQSNINTRCVVAALHQGIDLQVIDLVGDLPDRHVQRVPNPYQTMIQQDIESDEDGPMLLQLLANLLHSPLRINSKYMPGNKPLKPRRVPRMRTTLGDHNVLAAHASPPNKRRCHAIATRVGSLVQGSVSIALRDWFYYHPDLTKGTTDVTKPFGMTDKPYTQRHRLGEASVPGPSHEPDTRAKWAIGAVNPTGLAGKAVLFSDLPAGIYAISETHLTSRGKARFKQELWYAKSPFTLTTGADAPFKKANMRAVGGKHTGAGFLSSFPARPLRLGWDMDLYSSSRLHAATFQIHNSCIAGAVCYGYAQAADTKATQELTDKLLAQITSIVVEGFPGPSFVAGDFNQTPGILQETLRWEALGWKDIQTWANEQWGILPGPTCCHVSRKDYIYLSPSMQALLTSCSNTFDKFLDHSTLVGLLNFPTKPVPIARWPKPQTIDYTDLTPDIIAKVECPPAPTHRDPTKQYAAICTAFEEHVSRVRCQRGFKALHQSQCGRGQTLERTFHKPQLVTVKTGREGDYQPKVHTWTLSHCRWVTQCRRLQHYVKHLRKNSCSPTATEQRAAIWRSIVNAAGFPKGFTQWWTHQATLDDTLYPLFPTSPPSLELAQHMSQVFKQQLTVFESRIISRRIAMAKANRATDINRVFKDVRKPMPVPVNMLVAKSVAHVVEVVDEGSVIVDSTEAIQNASILESRQGPMHIIHIEEGQVWFTSPHSLVAGDTLAEVSLRGQPHEIHEAFITEWVRRWDRHRHLEAGHWDEVLEITRSLLHCPVMELKPITLPRWKAAIQAKKARSATGLDALARKDLLSFPDSLHLQLIHLFHQAELTGEWPRQLLQGAVFSLEKVPHAQSVNEYRPITVMPLAYRIYTTLRSREVLLHLRQHVPPTLLGNIPGRQAASLWWTMQHRIELALQASEPLTGATSDLVKAFNHLPREVTFQVASCMGVHPNIIKAWAASTTQLKRHFVVKNSPSSQVGSTTGFVEGCGMSVVAMVLVNSLIHAFLQAKHPEVTFTTYVDNYELQSTMVHQTTQALQSLDGFCKLLDIQLDQKKTYRWACSAQGRQLIRDAQDTLVTAARDLVAHMQFDARQTNSTVTAKFKALPDLWHLLARSQASYDQKIKILRTVAWPRAMYAIATVNIGNSYFVDARAGAFNAIGCTKAGANPQIHLSLITHPTADPEFYALLSSVLQFRRNIPVELLDLTLAPAAITPARKRKPGPGGVLLTRLNRILWTYVANGIFRDDEGMPVHILDTPIQDLRLRLTRAWQQTVGRQWETRKGFDGLRHVCVPLSKPATSYSPDELGFLRVAQNGTFFTHDALIHSGVVEDARCKFCSEPDSVFHRHWQCRHTEDSRSQIPSEVRQFLMEGPDCLAQHGWATEPQPVVSFRAALHQIPDSLGKYVPIEVTQPHIDLFCDGSGIDPKRPLTRLVSWAVVLAGAHPMQPHVPLAWGGVPGQYQTIVRAELFAFVSAVQFCYHHVRAQGATGAIWSDCEFIVRRAQALQQDLLEVSVAITDHDLWAVVKAYLPPPEKCVIYHIKSHQAYQDEPAWLQWACSANDAADKLAEFAMSTLPSQILQLQKDASEAQGVMLQAVAHMHAHIVRVAKLSVAEGRQQTEAPSRPIEHVPEVNWMLVARAAEDHAPPKLRFQGFHKLLQWCRNLHDPNAPLKWISWYELLFLFQLQTGEWGIQSTSSHNTWQIYSKIAEYDLHQACRSWAAFLLQLIRLVLPGYKAEHNRPSNSRFTCWAMGVLMRISPAADASIHAWLQSQMGSRPITKITQLLQLPFADAAVSIEEASSQVGLHRFWTSG